MESCIDYALVNERHFVLRENHGREQFDPPYVIIEYQWHRNRPYWTEESVFNLTDGLDLDDELVYVVFNLAKDFSP